MTMGPPESDWLSLAMAFVLPLAGVILIGDCDAEAAQPDVPDALRWALLDVEEHAGVPAHLSGMTIAAGWHESKFAPWVIAGVKRGDGGRAAGMLQMHSMLRRHCGLEDVPACGVGLTSPRAVAWCWLGRIVEVLPKARRKCPGWDPWVVAWAWVAQGPQGYRCRAPRHLDVLRRMRR